MANALIAYANRADSGVVSGGSWFARLPLANLQSRNYGQVARSADLQLTSTKFLFDAQQQAVVRVLALAGHSLSLSAQYRVRAYLDSGLTLGVVDTGWTDVWPRVYPFGTLDWGAPNWWSLRYAPDEVVGLTPTVPIILDGPTRARFWLVEIDDRSNEDGYIQIGRLFVAEAWQPTRNMRVGAALGWEDPTTVQEAISGQESFYERAPYRVATFTTEGMGEGDALSRAFEIQRRMGVKSEVLFIWDPEDAEQALRRQFVGRLRKLSPIEYPFLGLYSAAWEVKELIGSVAISAANATVTDPVGCWYAPVTTATHGTTYPGFTCLAVGGTGPYVFAVAAGQLPAGLSLDATLGTVTGSPSGVETRRSIVIKATDALGRIGYGAAFDLIVS
jgi:hypothetical protein